MIWRLERNTISLSLWSLWVVCSSSSIYGFVYGHILYTLMARLHRHLHSSYQPPASVPGMDLRLSSCSGLSVTCCVGWMATASDMQPSLTVVQLLCQWASSFSIALSRVRRDSETSGPSWVLGPICFVFYICSLASPQVLVMTGQENIEWCVDNVAATSHTRVAASTRRTKTKEG
jgi:hypothetical protein